MKLAIFDNVPKTNSIVVELGTRMLIQSNSKTHNAKM